MSIYQDGVACDCAEKADLFELDQQPGAPLQTEKVAHDAWADLHRCLHCGQLWRMDFPDRLQTAFVVRIPSLEGWEEFDVPQLRKDFLLRSRGGLANTKCIWAGCSKPQVEGVAYCVDHLFETGAQK